MNRWVTTFFNHSVINQPFSKLITHSVIESHNRFSNRVFCITKYLIENNHFSQLLSQTAVQAVIESQSSVHSNSHSSLIGHSVDHFLSRSVNKGIRLFRLKTSVSIVYSKYNKTIDMGVYENVRMCSV